MPHFRGVFRLPLCRLCIGSRWPIWFSSGQSVCSGWGSESISWARESEFRTVICVPRVTVSACGQMELFWMTSVFALELGVHPALGLEVVVVPGDELLPPHATTSAMPPASAPPIAILRISIHISSDLGSLG